jgi:hypothetical protein
MMMIMTKKNENEKRTVQMKFLVTGEEKRKIRNYAQRYFQTNSDFIRSAILDRILQFDRMTLPQKSDPRFNNIKPTTNVMKELKTRINHDEEKEGKILSKPDESELKRIQKEKKRRIKELEKELKNIEQQIKK